MSASDVPPTTTSSPSETGVSEPFANGSVAKEYLTSDAEPLGGVLKSRPEDFLVEELPLYQPAGQGEHLYLMVEKRDLSTFELIDVIAEHFGVERRAVGFAGLKDKHAITRQILSVHVPTRSPTDFPMLRHERISILWADQHTNKLRRGHLKGNRFSIRVRGVRLDAALQAAEQMEVLATKGIPNRLGPQRFGHLGNNHLVGLAMVRGDLQGVLDALLGPQSEHPGPQAEARQAYAAGDFTAALNGFPRLLRAECQALQALSRGQNAKRAVRSIDRRARSFYLSAFQSAVFNKILDERLSSGTWDTLAEGDVMMSHEDRAETLVTPHTLEACVSACRALQASPTGPMWGGRMPRGQGPSDELEQRVLEALGLSIEEIEHFARTGGEVFAGSRRPLRVPVSHHQVEGGADGHGPYLRVAFDLPRGSFATVVMDELMKNGAPDASALRAAERQAVERRTEASP